MEKEAIKLREAFPAGLAQGSPESADGYWRTRGAAALGVAEAKIWCGRNSGRPEREGLSVDLKEVLANCQMTQEGEAGLSPGFFLLSGGQWMDGSLTWMFELHCAE